MKRGCRFFLLAAIAELIVIGFCIVCAGVEYESEKVSAMALGEGLTKQAEELSQSESGMPESESFPKSGEGMLASETGKGTGLSGFGDTPGAAEDEQGSGGGESAGFVSTPGGDAAARTDDGMAAMRTDDGTGTAAARTDDGAAAVNPDSSPAVSNPDGGIVTANPDGAPAVSNPSGDPAAANPNGDPAAPNPGGEIASANPNGGSAGANPDGGLTAANSGGEMASANSDGAPAASNPNGDPASANPDSNPAVANPNGGIATTNPDGAPAVPNPNGEPAVPNPNGGIATENPDGVPAVSNSGGEIAAVSPDGDPASNPNGAPATLNPDGETATANPNGDPAAPNPDSDPAVTNPNGAPATLNPDGETAAPNPNGDPATVNPNSNPAVTNPNGDPATLNPDGETAVSNPNGDPAASNPDGNPAAAYSDTGSDPANPDGGTVSAHPDGTEKEGPDDRAGAGGTGVLTGEGSAKDSDHTYPSVRIRLTTSDYSSEYHDSVTITGAGTFWLEAQEKAQIFTGGQTVTISREHPFFVSGSIRVLSETGLIQIDSIAHRGQVNTYPGFLELYLTDQGIVIINEVDIEAYVERVVPSEMPASYGAEAARLQAVCARTYAYQRLRAGQIDRYGAIANDSTDNQVYNASLLKEVSSQATAETAGTILTYQGEPIVPYYFSTSCGFNTDNTAWSGTHLPYLRAQNLSYRAEIDLHTEDTFRNFILDWGYPAYEDDCTWYRWNYTISLEELRAVLAQRVTVLAQQSPGSFRAVTREGAECQTDAGFLWGLQEIAVTSRLNGGMAGELALICDAGTIYVTKEMVLRCLLGNPARIYSNRSSEGFGESEGNYLPSAFFIPVANREQDKIVSYTICGGGNGHGIGLSQNAAYAMLQSGLTWGEVLQFFYLGTSLEKIY